MTRQPAIFDNQKINKHPRNKAIKALEIAKQQEKEKLQSGKYKYKHTVIRGLSLTKIK